jgi:hypothetical protein
VNLRLLPGLAERGQVLARVPVEEQLVLNGLEGELGKGLVSGKSVFRKCLSHVSCGEQRLGSLMKLMWSILTFVERHGSPYVLKTGAVPRGRPINAPDTVPTRFRLSASIDRQKRESMGEDAFIDLIAQVRQTA